MCLLLLVCLACNQQKPGQSWEKLVRNTGTSSSPHATDLNKDGVLDIVLGAGAKEWEASANGVLAFNGQNGELLWSAPVRNQITGSPHFQDVTGDSVADVFIGGRSAQLVAINGATGAVLWEYLTDTGGIDFENDTSILNFYNLQNIPDQDADGLPDLLTAYGGFVKAQPFETGRPTGRLVVVSAATGKLLAAAPLPDKGETYMSPVLHDFEGQGRLSVIFGTGGETLGGSLYLASLEQVLAGDLTGAKVLASSSLKGFVAPPVLADITADGVEDIACNAVDGRFLLLDGKSHELLWQVDLGRDYESYSMPAPGYFNGDDVPDFFISYGKGQWPDINRAVQLAVDGRDGQIIFSDSSGCFQYASPVVADLTGDGLDDVLFTINLKVEVGESAPSLGKQDGGYRTVPVLYNIHNKTVQKLAAPPLEGTNLGATPLLTDLDNNGRLDLVLCRMTDNSGFFSFRHLVVARQETSIELKALPQWGNYMGIYRNGLFKGRGRKLSFVANPPLPQL